MSCVLLAHGDVEADQQWVTLLQHSAQARRQPSFMNSLLALLFCRGAHKPVCTLGQLQARTCTCCAGTVSHTGSWSATYAADLGGGGAAIRPCCQLQWAGDLPSCSACTSDTHAVRSVKVWLTLIGLVNTGKWCHVTYCFVPGTRAQDWQQMLAMPLTAWYGSACAVCRHTAQAS